MRNIDQVVIAVPFSFDNIKTFVKDVILGGCYDPDSEAFSELLDILGTSNKTDGPMYVISRNKKIRRTNKVKMIVAYKRKRNSKAFPVGVMFSVQSTIWTYVLQEYRENKIATMMWDAFYKRYEEKEEIKTIYSLTKRPSKYKHNYNLEFEKEMKFFASKIKPMIPSKNKDTTEKAERELF